MLHLQVGGSGEHSRDSTRCEREAGGVHEVQQQGHATRAQPLRKGKRETSLTTSTIYSTREDCVEESTVGEDEDMQPMSLITLDKT